MEEITVLPYSTLFGVWILLVVGFAAAYALLATVSPEHAPRALMGMGPLSRLGNSLYFSIITSTTTGYGDIVPQGFSKVLASIQSIFGFFILAIFVSKLVSKRQEIAIQEVHRLTYEDVFHNTREGLYVIRRDFDRIIAKLEQNEPLGTEDWEDLATAYKQGQSLLLEIPEFYGAEKNPLYTIDERREQLLQEAVHRTLHRINHLIDACGIAGIDWTAHAQSAKELHALLAVVATIAPLWQARSPYKRGESFETILRLKDRVANRLAKTLPL